MGRLEESLAVFEQAIALRPSYADVHYNRGNVLAELRRYDEAIAAYRQCLQLAPQHAEAHANLAGPLLLTGDFAQGWREYEWRWRVRDFTSPPRNFAQPRWDGSELAGRRILIHAEQGIGDMFQFLRYLPLVAARGGRVILECRPETKRLAAANADGWEVLASGETLPAFDVHCPLLSLPLAFGTRLETIPAKVPYMRVDPALAEKWRQRLAGVSRRRKVGLAWAGNPVFKFDHLRSPRELAVLAPLGAAADVEFVSLQKGKAASQAAAPPPGMRILDWTNELNDFAETAALIAGLDVVVSSDTALAHLAGAMGKQVYVMLPAAPDWRWLLTGDSSPWYPTARLFRQSAAGRWDDVAAGIAAALA
jgi:tetratricopeptide (TPR) repeat protein